MVHVCALVSACIRSCDNGGTLVEGNCTCDCTGGFNGTNCESECIVYKEVNPSIYIALLYFTPLHVVLIITSSVYCHHHCSSHQGTKHLKCSTLNQRVHYDTVWERHYSSTNNLGM